MVIFHSYVNLPEGIGYGKSSLFYPCLLRWVHVIDFLGVFHPAWDDGFQRTQHLRYLPSQASRIYLMEVTNSPNVSSFSPEIHQRIWDKSNLPGHFRSGPGQVLSYVLELALLKMMESFGQDEIGQAAWTNAQPWMRLDWLDKWTHYWCCGNTPLIGRIVG